MTTYTSGYPLPRNADEFERLCLKLLRRHWQLPQLERLRDPQRAEKGIDLIEVSGRPRLAAVRCDLRGAAEALAISEVKEAVERAARTKLPIGRFVIATTAVKPDGFDRSLFELNRANRAGGISTVEVLVWQDLEQLLDEYPQIMTEFGTAAKRHAPARADEAVHLEARCDIAAVGSDGSLGEGISTAAAHLEAHQYQMARMSLMRIREQRWSEITPAQKFVVLTMLGTAWLREGEARRAAMLLIAAKSLAPDEENACTNEALAHELLGERDRAFALADKLRNQFPSSGRALALWLNNASHTTDARTLEENVAPELASDPEVAVVMARRSLAQGDYERAERYSRLATTSVPNQSWPWLILAQSMLLGEVGSDPEPDAPEPAAEADPSAAESEPSRIKEAESAFSQAISLAESEDIPANKVQALLGRAQARIAMRDTEGAGKDIEEAHRLEKEDANGLCEYGIVLRSRGSLDEAIAVFRRAAASGGRDDAAYHLAITLRERDQPGDLQESAGLLSSAILRPQSIPSGDYPFAVATAIDSLTTLERWHEADSLLAQIPEGKLPRSTMLTLKASMRLANGKYDQAAKAADEAIAALTPDASPDIRRKLAALLHELGRYRDALPLWMALSPAGGAASTDTRRLLDCAGRLGREDIVLDVMRRFSPIAVEENSTDGVPKHVEKLERTDPESALLALEQCAQNNPNDKVIRLRRSIAAAKVGRKDLIAADPTSMPSAAEIPTRHARMAVQIMRDGGRANESLAYAYDIIRRRPADLGAHRAYLAAFGPVGPAPQVADFDTASMGTAVCFNEQDVKDDRWIVLEDSADADEARDEFGAASGMARALKGRKVGDKFQLPEGRFSRKTATVKQIINKFAWRYIDVLNNWQSRFPGQAEIEAIEAKPEIIPWAEMQGDFDHLFESPNGRREDATRAAVRAYEENPIPLHAVAQHIGLNDLQTMFIMAQRPDAPIKCCTGSAEEFDQALGAFDRANAVVLDLTAIATLCLLGRLNLLPTWPRQFVVSQSTLAELRRLAFEDNLMRLPAGFSASMTLKGNDGKRIDVQLKGLADALQSVCRVRDSAVLSAIDPERRDRLVRFFGRHGAESIVIASMPGHVLWTDDRILANLARAEFGVRRVWTQAALQGRAQSGNLDPAELATATTKLAGWGYSFTTPSVETIMRAGSVAVWNPDQFPLRQALDQFGSESLSLADSVRLAAELIVKIYNDAYLRGTRRTVTSRILDRLGSREGGRETIETLPRSLPVRFGLDLIRARELSDVVRGWTAQNEMAQMSAA